MSLVPVPATARAFAIALPFVAGCLVDPDAGADEAATAQSISVSGYAVVTDQAPIVSTDTQLTVRCPAGSVALGASAAVLDDTLAYTDGTITASVPDWSGQLWIVGSRTDAPGGFLRASVICSKAPAGYEIVTAATGADLFPRKQIDLACPAGKHATGAGYATVDPTAALLPGEATYFLPSWDGRGWLVNGRPLAYLTRWALHGYLVCATDDALPGYEVVTTESALTGGGAAQVIGACPGALVATGAGWGVVDSTYAILDGHVANHEVDGSGTTWLTNAATKAGAPWRLQQRQLCVE